MSNLFAAMSLEGKGENPTVVNHIKETRRCSGKKNQSGGPNKDPETTCYPCGRPKHFGRDPDCPARGHFCRKCGMEGQFQEQCKTKPKGGVRQTRIKQHRDSKRGAANMVDFQDNEDDPVCAFEVDIKK